MDLTSQALDGAQANYKKLKEPWTVRHGELPRHGAASTRIFQKLASNVSWWHCEYGSSCFVDHEGLMELGPKSQMCSAPRNIPQNAGGAWFLLGNWEICFLLRNCLGICSNQFRWKVPMSLSALCLRWTPEGMQRYHKRPMGSGPSTKTSAMYSDVVMPCLTPSWMVELLIRRSPRIPSFSN